jgi:signal peptidase I
MKTSVSPFVAALLLTGAGGSARPSAAVASPAHAAPGVVTFRVPSPAMEPTLHSGDEITVDTHTYRAHNPMGGDIVVFHPPAGADLLAPVCGDRRQGLGHAQACGVPTRRRSGQELVKRVVALPGDRISIKDGHVIRNGVRERDPYIADCGGESLCNFRKSVLIPRGEYFMLGDNRGASDDSSRWGPVRKSWIVGRMIRG